MAALRTYDVIRAIEVVQQIPGIKKVIYDYMPMDIRVYMHSLLQHLMIT